MHVSRRQWDRYMLASTNQVCSKLEAYFAKIDGSWLWKVRHWFSNRLDHGWRDEADFKMCELLFKQQFHLDRTFDYNLYIMLVLEEIVRALLLLAPCFLLLAAFQESAWPQTCLLGCALLSGGEHGEHLAISLARRLLYELRVVSLRSGGPDHHRRGAEPDGVRGAVGAGCPGSLQP
jgi:hypothetical protein